MQFNYEFLLKLELTDFVPTCSWRVQPKLQSVFLNLIEYDSFKISPAFFSRTAYELHNLLLSELSHVKCKTSKEINSLFYGNMLNIQVSMHSFI